MKTKQSDYQMARIMRILNKHGTLHLNRIAQLANFALDDVKAILEELVFDGIVKQTDEWYRVRSKRLSSKTDVERTPPPYRTGYTSW